MKESTREFIKKNKVNIICTVVTLVAITVAITYNIAFNAAMSHFNQKVAGINERQAMFNKLSDVDQSVRQDYVGTIDEKALQESLCNGYINGLPDSYSLYMSEEVYKLYNAFENGKSFNIGVTTIQNGKGQIEVVDVQPQSPAESAGIKKGDIILKINNYDTSTIKYEESLIRLTGTPGSQIDIYLLREESEALKVTVTCSKLEMNNIDYSIVNNKVGYISIYRFDNLLPKKFEEAVSSLKDQGAESYIIDLRNNFFGDMEYSAKVLDYLLPGGELISTIDKNGESKLLYTSGNLSMNSKFVVLVNKNTSGAGEIFASAVKDYGVAKIIGENTAGKTTYNKVIPFSDGSAILLPTAHYITKNSGVLTGVGLLPDKVINMPETKKELLIKRDIKIEDDNQVQEALKELLGDAYSQADNKDEQQPAQEENLSQENQNAQPDEEQKAEVQPEE